MQPISCLNEKTIKQLCLKLSHFNVCFSRINILVVAEAIHFNIIVVDHTTSPIRGRMIHNSRIKSFREIFSDLTFVPKVRNMTTTDDTLLGRERSRVSF